VALFDDFKRETLAEFPHLTGESQGRRLLYETIRRMLSAQVYDVIAATGQALDEAEPQSVQAVRQLPPLVQFGDAMRAKSQTLKKFLYQQLYRHPQVTHTTGLAAQVVTELFAVYQASPHEMQPRFMARSLAAPSGPEAANVRARVVADYIAGMTDRFAGREHERLTGLRLL
jgi:dGTPase